MPANGRLTVNIEAEDPALANAAVSTTIDATLPVIVERAQYWPDPAPIVARSAQQLRRDGGRHEVGTRRRPRRRRAAYQTYILIANPGATTAANVTITFLLEGGAPVDEDVQRAGHEPLQGLDR